MLKFTIYFKVIAVVMLGPVPVMFIPVSGHFIFGLREHKIHTVLT